ncbi:MAG: TraR/DksA C4-type zinc finger protein [Limnohabitans sp.]
MNSAQTETHRQTLLRLRQSLLDRIAHERGGVALPEARLQACPTALRCTACQTRFEAAH